LKPFQKCIAAFVLQHATFPPLLVSPKFLHVPLGVCGWPFATNSEGVELIVRALSFQDFQPMWSWSTNVTDRRTDGRHATARQRFALYSASRGKNTGFYAFLLRKTILV